MARGVFNDKIKFKKGYEPAPETRKGLEIIVTLDEPEENGDASSFEEILTQEQVDRILSDYNNGVFPTIVYRVKNSMIPGGNAYNLTRVYCGTDSIETTLTQSGTAIKYIQLSGYLNVFNMVPFSGEGATSMSSVGAVYTCGFTIIMSGETIQGQYSGAFNKYKVVLEKY